MALTETEGLTLEDLERVSTHAGPGDHRRYELLGGSIIVNAAPRPRHQLASGQMYELLRAGCPPGHRVIYSPIDLDLVGEQRVEPDLVVVPHASIGEERLVLPVLLVVELVSPSSALWDTVAKRDAYAASGIEHYWLVDTRGGRERFTALRLAGDRYEAVADSTERIETEGPIEVSAPLSTLFDPPG